MCPASDLAIQPLGTIQKNHMHVLTLVKDQDLQWRKTETAQMTISTKVSQELKPGFRSERVESRTTREFSAFLIYLDKLSESANVIPCNLEGRK